MIDEFTRECLAIRVARRLGRYELIETLADVLLFRGIPENIRSESSQRSCGSGWQSGHGNAVHRAATAKASTGSCGRSA